MKYTVIDEISIQVSQRRTLLNEVKECLSDAARYYPNFDKWFDKIINETYCGLRTVITAQPNTSDDIVGLVILKHGAHEEKICSIWVHPYFRYRGIGSTLLNKSMTYFKTNPVISIPDVALHDFDSWIKKHDFALSTIVDDCYMPGHKEYFFSIPLKRNR